MPSTKQKSSPATASARTARRRATWDIVLADSFVETEAETRAYWRKATPAERFNALEKNFANPFMAKIKLAADFSDFLKLCLRNEVRFLVIGGYAVIHHSRSRYTGDLDIWIDASQENAERVVTVLKEFGFPGDAVMVKGEE